MIRFWLFFLLILLFGGCSSKQHDFSHSIFQTSGASRMREYQLDLDELLLNLQIKLQKRNPKIFSKNIKYLLKIDMKNNSDTIFMSQDYKKCLKKAFSEKSVKYRGDYLVVGLYKMFYQAFDRNDFHKISALQYDPQKLQKAYALLQAISWKIKVAKDKNGNYLFLTWQNNWQIELQKRLKQNNKFSVKLINNLQYIKNKKESLFSPSNLSFESIFDKMSFVFEKALKTVGVEPRNLSTQALKSLLILL